MAAPSQVILRFFGVGKAPNVPKLEDAGEREMSVDDAVGEDNKFGGHDEHLWLHEHVKELRMNSYDNVKRRYSVMMDIYKAMPKALKAVLWTAVALVFFLVLPVAVWMAINVFSSLVATSKVLMLICVFAVFFFLSLFVVI